MTWRIALLFSLVLVAACRKETPQSTRWDDAAATAPPVASASSAPIETGSLNKYFPKDGEGGYARVFTADKPGYAEAKLQKDGKDVAQLTISDADRVPGAKEKFAAATEKLDGYPLMQVGKNQSTILVKDRLQVKVSSQTLDEAARKAILSTFDLKGLSTR
jgi:hypothetical protein